MGSLYNDIVSKNMENVKRKPMLFSSVLFYNIFVVHPKPGSGRRLVHMEIVISFLVSCTASIIAYYVCKWLDGGK